MGKNRSGRYREEFKNSAVELIRTSGKSLSQLSKELGVAVSTLATWNQISEEAEADTESEQIKALKAEYSQLKRSYAKLQEENAILKKASAYFAQQMK